MTLAPQSTRRPYIPVEMRKIYRQARHQGWRVVQGNRMHTLWYAPDGATIITVPSSPSDHRSFPNCIARMHRAGLERTR